MPGPVNDALRPHLAHPEEEDVNHAPRPHHGHLLESDISKLDL